MHQELMKKAQQGDAEAADNVITLIHGNNLMHLEAPWAQEVAEKLARASEKWPLLAQQRLAENWIAQTIIANQCAREEMIEHLLEQVEKGLAEPGTIEALSENQHLNREQANRLSWHMRKLARSESFTRHHNPEMSWDYLKNGSTTQWVDGQADPNTLQSLGQNWEGTLQDLIMASQELA